MVFWLEKQVAPLHVRENQHLGDEMLRTGYRNLTGEQPSVHIESFQSEEIGPFKSTCRVLMVTHWSVQHNLLLWIHIRTKSYSCSCLHVENLIDRQHELCFLCLVGFESPVLSLWRPCWFLLEGEPIAAWLSPIWWWSLQVLFSMDFRSPRCLLFPLTSQPVVVYSCSTLSLEDPSRLSLDSHFKFNKVQ